MTSHYGHVAPIRLAIEGTAALASARATAALESDGDGNVNVLPRPRKTARFVEEPEPELPQRLAELTYDELVDLRNTALALALEREAEEKKDQQQKNEVTSRSSSRKRAPSPPRRRLPDPAQLRDLVVDALAAFSESALSRESIDRLSLQIARQACNCKEEGEDGDKEENKKQKRTTAPPEPKIDRRKKGYRRRDVEAARAVGVKVVGVADAADAEKDQLSEDDDDDDDENEESATLLASVQLAVKQFLLRESKKKKKEGKPTAARATIVVGMEEKERGADSYLDAASDDEEDYLLFSAAEELRMPFFEASTAAGEASLRRKTRKPAVERRGERAVGVLASALALAEALRVSVDSASARVEEEEATPR